MSNVSQSSVVAGRRIIVVILTALLLWAGGAVPSAQAAVGLRVDLKVLLISDGSSQSTAWAALLDREGVPYTTVSVGAPGRPEITDEFLADVASGRGYFQAVVAPDQWATGLTVPEVEALFKYERNYGVRQVNAYAFPGLSTGQTESAYDGPLDGAAASVTNEGLAGPFTYLTGSLTIDDFDPRPAPTGTEVYGNIAQAAPALPAGATYTPLVNATAGGHSGTIIGVYNHDFREQLSISAVYNKDQQWFNTVGHGILTWMTRGIHLGYQRNYLNVQVDDVFLPDNRWSSIENCTPGDVPDLCIDPTATDIRMVPSDVTRLVNWQNANDFTMDMVFNAQGSDYAIEQAAGPDPLTDAFLAVKGNFTWVNHTYTHTFLGCIQIAPTVLGGPWHCATPEDDGPYYDESVAGVHEVEIDGVRWLTQAKIASEITVNNSWAVAKGLPNYDPHALVTGEHAGLRTLPQQTIDNPGLAPALEAAGITYTASDASREPDSRTVEGGATITVPRYPMNIFYNAGTYGDEVDEYNWIYTSEANGGSGICEEFPDTTTCIDPLPNESDGDPVGSAEASFMDYIVPIEVRNAYRKVITNDPRPFYAHQSNLAEDGILYPVVEGILDRYKNSYDATKSPIVTEGLVTLGQALNRMTEWASEQDDVTAYIDATGVHVSGPDGTPVPLTVPAGTSGTGGNLDPYGGELSGWLNASSSGAIVAVPAIPMGGYVGHSVPDAPAPVIATPGPEFYGSVALTWSAPADDGNSPITDYVIQQSLNTPTPVWGGDLYFPASQTTFTVTGLTPGAEYIYRIRAVNAVGTSVYSAASAPVIAPMEPNTALPQVLAPDVQYGNDVSITLTVATAEGDTPTGTTTLTIGGETYSQPIVGDAATFTVPGLAVGSHSYLLEYGNDPRILAFTWGGAVSVTKADVTVTGALGTPPSPLLGGTYDIEVVQPAGLPAATGDVTLTLTKEGLDDVTVPGTLDAGAVTVDLPSLAAGTWTASVAYAGDANYFAIAAPGASVVSTTADVTVLGAVVTAPSPQEGGEYEVTVTQETGFPAATGNVTVTLTSGPATEVVTGTLDGSAVTVALPSLAAGTWDVSIAYEGDANYAATAVAGASVISAKAAVGLAGAAGTAPSPQGAGTYQVAVTQPAGLEAATGEVTVTLTGASGTEVVTGTLSGGAVTIVVPSLAAGTWVASVAYEGDANYLATTVAGESVVSAKAAVTVAGAVVTAPSPLEGGAYAVTVTQPTGLAAATGEVTVSLTSGLTTGVVTGTLSGGTATVDLPSLAAGTWTATLTYAGDANYDAITVAGASVDSTTAAVTVTGGVVTPPTPQRPGSYEVTVTQPAGFPAATGEVTVTLESGPHAVPLTGTLSGGAATVEVPPLAAGTWTATVAYAGDANYTATTDAGEPVVSAKGAVSSVVGSVVTHPTTTTTGLYKVEVTQPDGLAAPLGAVALILTNGEADQSFSGTLVGGVATFDLPELAAGTWTAFVAYEGDANYADTTANGAPVVSVKTAVDSVAGSVTAHPTTIAAGSYAVTVIQPEGLPAVTGAVTVTLTKGDVDVPVSGTLDGGVATITLPALAAGTWSASVEYAGDDIYAGATITGEPVISVKGAVDMVVGSVITNPSPTTTGTYEVTVTPASGLVAATGTVTVKLTKGLATATLTGTLVAGVAAIDLPELASGTWAAEVTYQGDDTYAPTTVAGAPVLSAPGTVDSLLGSVITHPTTIAAGVYRVQVVQPDGLDDATGTVTVTLTKTGTAAVTISGTLAAGAVTIPVPKLAAGTWTASVAYAGDANYAPKTVAGASVVVAKGAVSKVTATVTKKPTTTAAGSYKITATQPTGLAAVTGKVTVTLKKGTATTTVTGTLSGGAATIAVPKLAAGTWTASVAYAGDANYAPKTNAGPSVVVAKGAVSKVAAKVTKKPTTKKAGSYKITVTQPKGLAKATGKVTVTLKKGKVTKKVTGTLKSGAVTVAVPKLANGVWKASVAYAGNTTYAAKTSTTAYVVVGKTKVSKVATKVTKKPTTKKAGTYKVTVTQAKWLPTPTGKVTVTLKKGKVTKTVKGTLKAGVVTVKVPKLAKGTWKVKVAYPGNSNYVKKSVNGKSVVVK